jgi:hypothetical protein
MKKVLSSLLVFLLGFSCAVHPLYALPEAMVQSWAPEGVDIGGSRTPMPMPPGVMLSDVYPEFMPSLPRGYYLNDAQFDGQAFILLYRDSEGGSQEILMSVVQEDVDPHALRYVEGSYEQSGEQYLYFMLINGKTLHGNLYLFSIPDNRMNLVLEEPCSNNMVLFDDPPEDIAGLGWVLYKDYILPIKLSDGSSYEGGAASISQMGGMPDISGSFFAEGIGENERKYTYLTPLDKGILQLTTVVIDVTEQNPEKIIEQYYDCVNMRLTTGCAMLLST